MWFKLNHQPNSIFIMYFSLSQQTYNLGVQLTLQVKKSPSQPRLPCTNNCQLGVPFFFTSMLFCNFTSSKVTQDQNQQSVHPIHQFPHMQDNRGTHTRLIHSPFTESLLHCKWKITQGWQSTPVTTEFRRQRRGSKVQGLSEQRSKTLSQTTESWGCGSVVEYLPNKCKALGWIPSMAREREREIKEESK